MAVIIAASVGAIAFGCAFVLWAALRLAARADQVLSDALSRAAAIKEEGEVFGVEQIAPAKTE
jgi:hypothetical protein